MTAEIAIMNKEAIALASDSAVTMTTEAGQKIFTSANKLFALSKYHPVGIMIYGNATFMSVPWETIVKIYRRKLGKKKFTALKEYANDFVQFLDNGNPLFPDSIQEDYLRNAVYGYFNFIKETITRKVNSKFDEKRQISNDAVKSIVSEIIKEHYDKWQKTDNIPSIPKSYSGGVIRKYGQIIDKAIQEVFEQLPIPKSHLIRLRKIAASLFSKFPPHIESGNFSGIVIAGFGEEDTFPSLQSFRIEGIVNDRLKYIKDASAEIKFKTSASIVAFAQREMVATFMEGIDPFLKTHMQSYLSKIFSDYPKVIIESLPKSDQDEGKLSIEKLKEISGKIFQDYENIVRTYIRRNHIEPITKVVSILPKDELAVMAETLVNLTSFKRKVTIETETVGGPIDVAVISKGDGFVWIKRKHYFKTELNPQFLANYYREE